MYASDCQCPHFPRSGLAQIRDGFNLLLLPCPHNSLDMQDGSTSLPLYGFDVVAPWLCTAVHFACLAPLKRLLRHHIVPRCLTIMVCRWTCPTRPRAYEGVVFSYSCPLIFLQQTHRGHSQHSLEFPTIWPHWPETTSCNLIAEPQSLAAYVTDHDKLLGPGRIIAGQVAFAAGYFPNALEEWRRWAASAFRGF